MSDKTLVSTSCPYCIGCTDAAGFHHGFNCPILIPEQLADWDNTKTPFGELQDIATDLKVENDALRAQHIAEMNAKVEALEWRDKEICTLRKQLYDARYEANLANRGFETVEKQDTNLRAELVEWKSAHDNLARQLSVANDTVEIAYEGLRELMDRIEKGGNQDEPQQA